MTSKFLTLLCALSAVFLTFLPASAEEEVKIKAIPVTDQIYMLSGKGGSFLIDDQFAPLTCTILFSVKYSEI